MLVLTAWTGCGTPQVASQPVIGVAVVSGCPPEIQSVAGTAVYEWNRVLGREAVTTDLQQADRIAWVECWDAKVNRCGGDTVALCTQQAGGQGSATIGLCLHKGGGSAACLAHEIGHVLGLPHAARGIMYPEGGTLPIRKRDLPGSLW